MVKGLVIADDVTGANATGVLIKKNGYNVYTLLCEKEKVQLGDLECDCAIYSTDSRSISEKEAYQRVYDTVTHLKHDDIRFYAKRIDSTLRGNLAVEVEATLDSLGDEYIALVVPAFPSAGRTVERGNLFVNGILLEHTEVAKDPKNPINTSRVDDFFIGNTKYKVGSIYREDYIEQDGNKLKDKLESLIKDNTRIILCDASTNEHIELIAQTASQLSSKFVAVDPGVFSATLFDEICKVNRVIIGIGSVNPVTKEQVEHFIQTQEGCHVWIKTHELWKGETFFQAEVNRAVDIILSEGKKHTICSVLGDGLISRIDLKNYSTEEMEIGFKNINQGIAQIVSRILKQDTTFKSVYTSGGDITVEVAQSLGIVGIELIDQVAPLTAYGIARGGNFDGIRIITKGGMVGDKFTLVNAIKYLM